VTVTESQTVSTPRTTAAAALVGVVAAIGTLSALLVRSACVNPGPPVARPEPGTARAGFCGVMHGATLWLLRLAAPMLVTTGAALLARGRPRWWLLTIAVLAASAALANVFIVHSRDFAYTDLA
jgi:hypothetical protein